MRSTPILSRQRLKAYEQLLQKKHREREGRFIIEGSHLLEEALTAGWHIDIVLLTPEYRAARSAGALLERIERLGLECAELTTRMIAGLTDTVTPQGIVAVVRKPPRRPPGTGANLAVALDGVSDPGNLGTIVRTCDWFGVRMLLLGKGCVEPYNPKVVRATMGSLFHLELTEDADLVAELTRMKAEGFAVRAAAVTGGQPPARLSEGERLVVVLGNESRGVSDQVAAIADTRLSIPNFGRAESLNVATACGIILALLRLG